MKKHIIIVTALLLVVSTSEFLWMDVVSGKKYLLEAEADKGPQLEDKSSETSFDVKSHFSGSIASMCSLAGFEGTLSLITAVSEMHSQWRSLKSPRLYLLFCQLRQHLLA